MDQLRISIFFFFPMKAFDKDTNKTINTYSFSLTINHSNTNLWNKCFLTVKSFLFNQLSSRKVFNGTIPKPPKKSFWINESIWCTYLLFESLNCSLPLIFEMLFEGLVNTFCCRIIFARHPAGDHTNIQCRTS